MSTYLELVKQLHNEVGAAGTAPTSVSGLTGEAKQLADWIRDADLDIQNLWVNWRFLWKQFTTGNVTTAGVNSLTKPSDLNFWDTSIDDFGNTSFKIIEPGETDRNPLQVVEYDKVRGAILDTSQGVPGRAIIMPNDNLQFEPVPDAVYTIIADYYTKPTLLAANADISLIPETYHRAILGRAMIFYANQENAPEIKDQGTEIYTENLARLENHELPNEGNARFKTGGFFEVAPG